MQPHTKHNSVYLPHTLPLSTSLCSQLNRQARAGEHKIALSHYRRRPEVSPLGVRAFVYVCVYARIHPVGSPLLLQMNGGSVGWF